MQERRKLFYTEQEINELANAVEYTNGTTSDFVDYIFIPLGSESYNISLTFCNEYGQIPAVTSSSSKYANLTWLESPIYTYTNNSAYVIGPRWKIISNKCSVNLLFNGSTSGSGFDSTFYGSLSNYGSNSGSFYILPYTLRTDTGSRLFTFGCFDYLYNADEPTYIKILVGGHIGVTYNNYNYYYNKIVSASSTYPLYYIPLSV